MHTALAPLLHVLRCPCCGAPYQSRALSAGWALRCRRRDWPVVEGIAVLREGHETDRALHWLTRGDEPRALAVLLAADLRSRTDRWRGHGERLLLRRPAGEGPASRRSLRRLHKEGRVQFDTAVRGFFGGPPWPVPETAEYFLYRRSDPSFVAAEAAAAITTAGRHTILDSGCGVGHLLASIHAGRSGITVCGLDSLFPALLLARWYVAPRAALICADAGAPLPFVDGAFDALLSVDAFFDFPSLPGAATEFRRVLASDGAALIAHLHNRLTPHLYSGRTPLSPREYAQILAPLEPLSFYDEADILAAVIDPSASGPPAQDPSALAAAADVSVAAGRHPPLVSLSWFPADVGRRVLNPLYQAGGVLRRGSFRYTSERERGAIAGLLPDRIDADTAQERLLRARVCLPWPIGMHPRGTAFPLPAGALPSTRPHRAGSTRWLREWRSNRRLPEMVARLRNHAAERLPRGGVVFLMGHRVVAHRGPDPYDLSLCQADLEAMLVTLRGLMPLLSCEQALQGLERDSLSPGLSLALTFDDGTLDLSQHGAAVLRRHGARATVFVTGPEAAPAGRYWWDQADGGGWRADAACFLQQPDVFDVGHHSRKHLMIGTDAADLEALDHPARDWLAYPFGDLGGDPQRAAAGAKLAGFSAAFTAVPGIARPGQDLLLLPRLALHDAPLDGLLKRIVGLLEDG